LSLKRERGALLARRRRPSPKVFKRELYLTLQITIIESAASITGIVAGASFTLCSNLYFRGMLRRHFIRAECAECRIKNLQLRTYTRDLPNAVREERLVYAFVFFVYISCVLYSIQRYMYFLIYPYTFCHFRAHVRALYLFI